MNKFFASLFVVTGLVMAQSAVPNPPAIFPAGSSQPVIENTYAATAQTATISSFNLQCIPPSANSIAANPTLGIQPVAIQVNSVVCPAGVYRVSVTALNTTGTNGGGTVTNTVTYHASGTTQSINTAGTLTESTGNFVQGSQVFYSDGSANVTLATAQSSTGSYDIYVVLERIR